MQVEYLQWTKTGGWGSKPALKGANLVLYFFGREGVSPESCFADLRQFYPDAHILGCSTGGEILGAEVVDDSVAAVAVTFARTSLKPLQVDIASGDGSFDAGVSLARGLQAPDLKYILILSDGTNVNGSALIEGLYSVLPKEVIVTGGLAGDGANFKTTAVGLDAPATPNKIVAVGFYGEAIRISYGSVGGWKPFAMTRTITRSKGNILYELDGKPALQLYKVYLGEDAQHLPKSALLYPLNIRPSADSDHDIVRTIVGIDEKENSLIFAGDVPEGYHVRLMRAEPAQLVEGASLAASLAKPDSAHMNLLAILVSCIGRKLFLGPATSSEIAAVAAILPPKTPLIGFYSYGEICHQQFTHQCSLHNQTMTVTVLREEDALT